MPYISLDNLTQYNGRLRDYIDGSFDKLDGANWRKTSTGQSVSCWPIPESPLEPEVTFKFSETPPASGTKSPDNPSTITGVSTITVTRCETVGVDSTDYTINLGSTYYGGSIDLSAGIMTVTHYGMIFNGTESYAERDHSTYYRYRLVPTIPLPASGLDNQICNHFIVESSLNTRSQHFAIAADGTLHFITTQTTLATFTDWVVSQYQSGTPLTVAYKLATPYTVSLTPLQIYSLSQADPYTPRLNTVYTDASAVQVGYAKSALKTSEELTNAIISLGGNV